MKKIIIAALGLTLVLSGCAPKLDSNDKVVQKDDSKAETGIMTKKSNLIQLLQNRTTIQSKQIPWTCRIEYLFTI